MKLTDLSIEELRDICNYAGWSCRRADGPYKTKAAVLTFLTNKGVTNLPDDGKKLWSVTFNEWVNEVLGLEEYAERVLLRAANGYSIDTPNLPEYINTVTTV